MDSTLALATFLVWYKTTEGATAGSYFRETFGPLLIRCVYGGRGPSVAVHAFGIIQFLIGFIFAIRPGYAQVVFQLETFRDHAAGYLGAFFAVLCQSAWHQIYMGKAVSLSFNIGNVFSRFAFKIPLLAILTATKQIDLGLFAFLGALDFIFGFIILLLLCLSELRENAQGPDETDAILPPKSNDDAASIKPREWLIFDLECYLIWRISQGQVLEFVTLTNRNDNFQDLILAGWTFFAPAVNNQIDIRGKFDIYFS